MLFIFLQVWYMEIEEKSRQATKLIGIYGTLKYKGTNVKSQNQIFQLPTQL